MDDIMKLCDVVRETGFAIHRYHKHGHLEKVYENALAHRLRKLGLDVKQQYPLKVHDEDGTLIGDYNADLFVDMWGQHPTSKAGNPFMGEKLQEMDLDKFGSSKTRV
jgi:hypothetical protein